MPEACQHFFKVFPKFIPNPPLSGSDVRAGKCRRERMPANGFATLNRRGACSLVSLGHPRCCEPRIKRIISNVTDTKAIFALVTILLLFRIGVTKRRGPRIPRLRQGGRIALRKHFVQNPIRSGACFSPKNAQTDLWMERVVLTALATHAA